jgi:hypothetical protein
MAFFKTPFDSLIGAPIKSNPGTKLLRGEYYTGDQWLVGPQDSNHSLSSDESILSHAPLLMPGDSFHAHQSDQAALTSSVAPDPYYAQVSFLAGFDGAQDAVNYTEYGPLGKVLDFDGTAKIDTTTPYRGTDGCLLLDGSASCYATHWEQFDQAGSLQTSRNFTIEVDVWLDRKATAVREVIVGKSRDASAASDREWVIYKGTDGRLMFAYAAAHNAAYNIDEQILASGAYSNDQWLSIAISNDGTWTRIYVDGTYIRRFAPQGISNVGWAGLRFGADYSGGGLFMGRIKNFRLTKGLARYTTETSYTLETGPFGGRNVTTDPWWENVVALISCDGVDGAVDTTDESEWNHNVQFLGNTHVNNGSGTTLGYGASIRLDGAGDGVFFADQHEWYFGDAPFTVEMWLKFASADTQWAIVSKWGGTPEFWAGQPAGVSTGVACRFLDTGGANRDTSNYAFTAVAGSWQHWVLERNAAKKMRIYKDGAMVSSGTNTQPIRKVGNPLYFGYIPTAGYGLHGNLQEIRVTKGVARYDNDAGFSVPVAAFPRG